MSGNSEPEDPARPEGARLLEAVQSALHHAESVEPSAVPGELAALIELVPRLAEWVAELECAAARARRTEEHLDDVLDHLRVVEIAMGSLGEARDEAIRTLAEARRAAGLELGPLPHTALGQRIAELREEHARLAASRVRLRRALEACCAELRERPPGATDPELLRSAERALRDED